MIDKNNKFVQQDLSNQTYTNFRDFLEKNTNIKYLVFSQALNDKIVKTIF